MLKLIVTFSLCILLLGCDYERFGDCEYNDLTEAKIIIHEYGEDKTLRKCLEECQKMEVKGIGGCGYWSKEQCFDLCT